MESLFQVYEVVVTDVDRKLDTLKMEILELKEGLISLESRLGDLVPLKAELGLYQETINERLDRMENVLEGVRRNLLQLQMRKPFLDNEEEE